MGLQIYNEEEIERLVRNLPTPKRRINARKRLKAATNALIDSLILEKRELIRSLRSESESVKRPIYAEITQLEIKKL